MTLRPLAAFAGIFALTALGLAFAQETPPAPFEPAMEVRDDAGPPRSLYPARAMTRGVGGRVVLCCRPNEARNLSCAVARELPEDEGFGRVARSLFNRRMRLTEASYAAYQSAIPGQAFPATWRFELTGIAEAPDWPEGFTTEGMCAGQ